MGQKTHPTGFRLGVIRTWDSRWFREKGYAQWLHEDLQLRKYIHDKLKQAGIPTAVHYPIPLNKQPAVADAGAQLPVGDEVAGQVMSLPMSPGLAMVNQTQIAEILRTHQVA